MQEGASLTRTVPKLTSLEESHSLKLYSSRTGGKPCWGPTLETLEQREGEGSWLNTFASLQSTPPSAARARAGKHSAVVQTVLTTRGVGPSHCSDTGIP